MKISIRTALTMLVAATAAAALSTPALAQTPWDMHHPARAHDNARIAHQEQRINQGIRLGRIGPGEAARLRGNLHRIRQEERDMARQDGTHLTPADQAVLTQQLDESSRTIGRFGV